MCVWGVGGAGGVPHVVGAQRDPPSAARAELGLAVGAQVAAAVGELGLPADSTGGSVVLLLGLLTPRLRPDATHFLFVALKLLVQRSEGGRGGEMERQRCVTHSLTHKLPFETR